jgi:hypothetical protein
MQASIHLGTLGGVVASRPACLSSAFQSRKEEAFKRWTVISKLSSTPD